MLVFKQHSDKPVRLTINGREILIFAKPESRYMLNWSIEAPADVVVSRDSLAKR